MLLTFLINVMRLSKMGCDTHLYLKKKWEVEDILTVMKSHLSIKKVKVRSCKTCHGMFTLHFKYKTERMMYVHMVCETPIGTFMKLSLGMNAEAIEIMRKIALVLGGLLVENDCGDRMEFIQGKLCDENALPYFVRYAILHNEADENDLVSLNDSIHKWHDRVRSDRNDMNLFPKNADKGDDR